jgi:acyl-coenzyme A thioesterase PaaI-like protein
MEPLDEEHFPRPLRDALGLRRVVRTDMQQGAVTLAFEAPPQFLHSGGTTVQGGIVGAWIDHAMAWAVYAKDRQSGIATLELKTSYLSRVGPGESLVRASVVRWGRNVVFLEGEVLGADARPLVRASSTAMRVQLG